MSSDPSMKELVTKFLENDIEPHVPIMAQDCSICREPLIVATPGTTMAATNAHSAVKIKKCSHVFGHECLKTWVEDNNSCPMCRGKLYDDALEAVVQQLRVALRSTTQALNNLREHRDFQDIFQSAMQDDSFGPLELQAVMMNLPEQRR